MSAFALALMLGAAEAPRSYSITVSEIERITPVQLAARLLPAGEAGRVVDGTIGRGISPLPTFVVRLWERPEPVGAMLCRRRIHSTYFMARGDESLSNADTVLQARPLHSGDGFGTTYPEEATAERCERLRAYATGRSDTPEATRAAINILTEAMAAAAGPGELRFTLSCRAERGARGCEDARASLATLPLHEMFGVDLNAGTPTIRFGMSDRDGSSWFVTLISTEGRLTDIRMRRAWVIYH